MAERFPEVFRSFVAVPYQASWSWETGTENSKMAEKGAKQDACDQ